MTSDLGSLSGLASFSGPAWLTLLSAMLAFAVPLLFAATGECITERAGVLNIGVEGLMLGASLAAVAFSRLAGCAWAGLGAGVGVAVLLGAVFAWTVIERRANQVICGTALNLLCLGLTGVIFGVVSARLAGDGGQFSGVKLPGWPAPFFSGLPALGPTLFSSNVLVYAALLVAPLASFWLFRTRSGLLVRAAGEAPGAVDAMGAEVRRIRWAAVLAGSGFAGLGGCALTIGHVASFQENMVSGRGFIALALVIFGRWTPIGVAGGVLLFSLAWGLATLMSAQGRGRPEEVWLLALPYAATLVVLVFLRRARGAGAPASLGMPYP